MDGERCPRCDRVKATDADWIAHHAAHKGECRYPAPDDGHCYGLGDCTHHAVNWQERCKRAEAVLASEEGLPPVEDGVQPYMDFRHTRRLETLRILRGEA